ncbi:MAG: MarR family transcriptional regulator [Alphaproteobacteria bacterium]|nr:MarR family transcriptional regulator [Alphaproteobacteria bacterium]
MPANRLAAKPDAPGATRAGRFAMWFSLVSRALSQQMLIYARRELGLNLAEYRVLSVLGEHRTASIRELAVGAQFDKAQITRAVASLTRRGYAIHTVDGRDRRLRVVKLTPAGQALHARSVPFAIERQKRMERTLSAAELRVLWKALSALHEETQAMLAEEGAVRRPRARTAPGGSR